MKVSESRDLKMAKRNLQKELENLNNSHQNELDKVKNLHTDRKAQLKNDYESDLNRIQNESQRKLLTQNMKNEETLTDLQESLNAVKNRVNDEKKQILNMNEEKLAAEKELFEAKLQSRKVIQQAQLDDLHHQAQIENKKLQQGKKAERQEIEYNQRMKKQETLAGHQTKVAVSKEIYDKQFHAQGEKYRNALKTQERGHKNEIVTNERQHQKIIKNKSNHYASESTKIQSDGEKKISELNKRYEQKFKANFERAQESLAKLSKRRDDLENDLIAKMKENVEVEVNKDKDPFYKFQKLAPKIEYSPDTKSYKVAIETTPEAAKEYQLSAQGREIKIQMKRDFEFTHKNDYGVNNSVNKYESFSTRIPVDHILNGREISKSYEDGLLTFDVKLA